MIIVGVPGLDLQVGPMLVDSEVEGAHTVCFEISRIEQRLRAQIRYLDRAFCTLTLLHDTLDSGLDQSSCISRIRQLLPIGK